MNGYFGFLNCLSMSFKKMKFNSLNTDFVEGFDVFKVI